MPDIGEACKWLCSHFLVFICCNLIRLPVLIESPCFADESCIGLTICKITGKQPVFIDQIHIGTTDTSEESNYVLSTYPVTIGIIHIWKTSNRLLSTARAVGNIMRVQPEFRPLMHQLDDRAICYL